MNEIMLKKFLVVMITGVLFFAAAAGAASALSLEVDLPETITAGSSVTGAVYVTGAQDEHVTSYQIKLISDAPASEIFGIKMLESADTLCDTLSNVEVNANTIVFNPLSLTTPVTIDSSKKKVCSFELTAPTTYSQLSYKISVDLDKNQSVFYTDKAYYSKGNEGRKPWEQLTQVSDSITISESGAVPVVLEIEMPEFVTAGEDAIGSIYMVGGQGEKIKTYQICLAVNAADGETMPITINSTPVPLSDAENPAEFNGAKVLYTGVSSTVSLDTNKVLVCNFTVKVPASPKKSSYVISLSDDEQSIIKTGKYKFATNSSSTEGQIPLTAVSSAFYTTTAESKAVSLAIELPETAASDSEVTGNVYFVGGSGENVSGYSVYLTSNAPDGENLNIAFSDTPTPFGGASATISGSCIIFDNVDGAVLPSDKVLIGSFKMTVPKEPALKSYVIDFLLSPDKVTTFKAGGKVYEDKRFESGDESAVKLEAVSDVVIIDEAERIVYLNTGDKAVEDEDIDDPAVKGHSFDFKVKAEIGYEYPSVSSAAADALTAPVFSRLLTTGKYAELQLTEKVVVQKENADGTWTEVKNAASLDSDKKVVLDTSKLTDAVKGVRINFVGRYKGDVDGNNRIQARDAGMINSYLAGTALDANAQYYADVDGNSRIQSRDSGLINVYLAG